MSLIFTFNTNCFLFFYQLSLVFQGDIHICSALLEDQIENPSNANKTNSRHYANKAKKDNLKKPPFASSGISCYFPLEIEEQTKVSSEHRSNGNNLSCTELRDSCTELIV